MDQTTKVRMDALRVKMRESDILTKKIRIEVFEIQKQIIYVEQTINDTKSEIALAHRVLKSAEISINNLSRKVYQIEAELKSSNLRVVNARRMV